MNKYKLKESANFYFINRKATMKYDIDLTNYYDKKTRIFEYPENYVEFSLMSDLFNSYLIPLDLVEKVGDNNE